MSERMTIGEFLCHLDNVGQGYEAFHASLFPGVYPADKESHERRLKGETVSLYGNAHWRAMQGFTDRGGIVRRLRVLPPPREFGYTEDEVKLLRGVAAEMVSCGEQVCVVDYARIQDRIEAKRPALELMEQYLNGIETGIPKTSFWSLRRLIGTSAVSSSLFYVGMMDYGDNEFLGQKVYGELLPNAESLVQIHELTDSVREYEAFWRRIYFVDGMTLNHP